MRTCTLTGCLTSCTSMWQPTPYPRYALSRVAVLSSCACGSPPLIACPWQHTYMPTPGQLARQLSSEETFESLQAFQRKHTPLVTATPDPRYVRNDVKLLVALERGSVVKRTHNMNVVVCKMLQFIHPDSQRNAVGFVVSSRLKDPIVFKLNLEYPKSGNPVNFPYPDKDNLPIVAHIPSNS